MSMPQATAVKLLSNVVPRFDLAMIPVGIPLDEDELAELAELAEDELVEDELAELEDDELEDDDSDGSEVVSSKHPLKPMVIVEMIAQTPITERLCIESSKRCLSTKRYRKTEPWCKPSTTVVATRFLKTFASRWRVVLAFLVFFA